MTTLTNAQQLYADYQAHINIYNPDNIFHKIIYYDSVNDVCYRKYNNIYGDTMKYIFPQSQTTISYNYNPFASYPLPEPSSNDFDIMYLNVQDKVFEVFRYLLTSIPGSAVSNVFSNNTLIAEYYPPDKNGNNVVSPIDPDMFSEVLIAMNHRYWSLKYGNPYYIYIPRAFVDKREMSELSLQIYQAEAIVPCGITYNF